MPEGSFREIKVRDQLALGADSGTVTVPLPTANYISGLLIRVQNTNGATSNTDVAQTVAEAITKVEIVADGTVAVTWSGPECRKFMHFDQGDFPPMEETQAGAEVQWASFPINFGTSDFDKEFVLPAWKYHTLDLKVTWAFTDSATAGFATSETNALMDVIVRMLVPPAGAKLQNTPLLSHKTVYSQTITSTGSQEAVLPVGAGNGALRRLMFFVYEAAIQDGTDVNTYSLLLNESQVIIDQRWDTSQIEDRVRYRAKSSKQVRLYKANGESWDSKVSRIHRVHGTIRGTCCGVIYEGTSSTADRVFLNVIKTSGPVDASGGTEGLTGARVVNVSVEGPGVSYATMLDLGTSDIRDSLNLSREAGVSSLKLKYNQNASGSTNIIVAENVVYI